MPGLPDTLPCQRGVICRARRLSGGPTPAPPPLPPEPQTAVNEDPFADLDVQKPLIAMSPGRANREPQEDEDIPRPRRRRRAEPDDRELDLVRPPRSGGLGIFASVLIGLVILFPIVLGCYEIYTAYLQIQAERNEEMAVRANAWAMGSSGRIYELLWRAYYLVAFCSGIVFLCWVYGGSIQSAAHLQVTGLHNTLRVGASAASLFLLSTWLPLSW